MDHKSAQPHSASYLFFAQLQSCLVLDFVLMIRSKRTVAIIEYKNWFTYKLIYNPFRSTCPAHCLSSDHASLLSGYQPLLLCFLAASPWSLTSPGTVFWTPSPENLLPGITQLRQAPSSYRRTSEHVLCNQGFTFHWDRLYKVRVYIHVFASLFFFFLVCKHRTFCKP